MDLTTTSCSRAAPRRDREETRSRNTDAWVRQRLPVRTGDDTAVYLQNVGARLALSAPPSGYRWEMHGVQSRSVRAFAIGGGRVYIGDGAIFAADDEAELAAIIAHEMAHQVAGHFRVPDEDTGFWRTFGTAIGVGSDDTEQFEGDPVMAFVDDPRAELEADAIGVRILESAGYDPRSALAVAERILSQQGNDPVSMARLDNLRRILVDRTPGGDRDSERFRRVKYLLE